MVKTMTRKEFRQRSASRAGRSLCQIYYKEGGSEFIESERWVNTREEAFEELERYKQIQALVSPFDREYFYRISTEHVRANSDGTVTVSTSFDELMKVEDRGGFFSKIRSVLYTISDFATSAVNMLKDMAFWIGHYSRNSRHGEDASDWWSLDCTLERKLLFNLPRLIENLHGCPQRYVNEAVDRDRAEKGLPPATRADYERAGREHTDAGCEAWKKELERLLLYVKLYRYYDSGGTTDEDWQKEIDAEYRKTLPVFPGTDGELDHTKCAELADEAWGKLWDLWKEIGRNCWD